MSPEGEKAQLEATHAVFGDIEFTIDGMIAEGDEVAVRWTATSNHQGQLYDFAQTGKRLTFHWFVQPSHCGCKIVPLTVTRTYSRRSRG